MLARAAIAADFTAGRTALTLVRSDPPLTVRATPDGVHLVGSAAGPLGGDDLGFVVRVGAGAALTVRGVAATLALPGPDGEPATFITDLAVGSGAFLRWEPEPVVAVAGCDLRTTTRIALADDASLIWREELVWGRHAEPGGSVLSRLVVDRGGRPLHRGDLVLGPAWPTSVGPAGTSGARAIGLLLVVGAPVTEPVARGDTRIAVMRLDEPATIVLVIGDRPGAVRAALDDAAGA